MLDLSLPKAPFDIALPYGLSVTVKPLTTAGMAAAQAAARRAVEAIERQVRERTEAGLHTDGLPDFSTEGERDGFYQAQLIRELAVRHVTSWAGVELGGGPAPPTPENLAAVMDLYPVGERFFQEFTLRQVLLNAAKNAFGLSAAGNSAGRRARVLQSLPRRRPALRPRRARRGPTALSLPRVRLDQPSAARGLGRAAGLPGTAAARTERSRDRHRHERSAEDRRRPRLRPRVALGTAAGCRGWAGRGFVSRERSA
jgi:hypothetical protein